MKSCSKKSISLLISLVMLISLIPMGASAARVGDVIGYAQPTDIVALINGYQLESYNVNGLTYIVAEDLRYYGFDVYFDSASRSLSVSRNYASSINPQATTPNFWNSGSTTKKSILYTDIVTYVNNEYVESSNINGKTIINFNEFSRFGLVSYDDARREITLTLSGLSVNPAHLLAVKIQNIYYNASWKLSVRAKGDLLNFYFTSNLYMTQTAVNDYMANKYAGDKNELQQLLDMYKANDFPVSSFYIECRNSDGYKITSYQLY